MRTAMLDYVLNPAIPERIDENEVRGGVATPAVRKAYIIESQRARSLKDDGYIICGLIVTASPAGHQDAAHTLYEICSSEKVFPVLLCAEDLMPWKRSGFAVEWYSPDSTGAEAWLDDIRLVWGMDMVTDLHTFLQMKAAT